MSISIIVIFRRPWETGKDLGTKRGRGGGNRQCFFFERFLELSIQMFFCYNCFCYGMLYYLFWNVVNDFFLLLVKL